MLSNASDDFPDPLSPVITVRLLRGISTSMFFRLCWRAPCTVIRSSIVVYEWKGRISYCDAACAGCANCAIRRYSHAKMCAVRSAPTTCPPDVLRTFQLHGDLRMQDLRRGGVRSPALPHALWRQGPLPQVRHVPYSAAQGPRSHRPHVQGLLQPVGKTVRRPPAPLPLLPHPVLRPAQARYGCSR